MLDTQTLSAHSPSSELSFFILKPLLIRKSYLPESDQVTYSEPWFTSTCFTGSGRDVGVWNIPARHVQVDLIALKTIRNSYRGMNLEDQLLVWGYILFDIQYFRNYVLLSDSIRTMPEGAFKS